MGSEDGAQVHDCTASPLPREFSPLNCQPSPSPLSLFFPSLFVRRPRVNKHSACFLPRSSMPSLCCRRVQVCRHSKGKVHIPCSILWFSLQWRVQKPVMEEDIHCLFLEAPGGLNQETCGQDIGSGWQGPSSFSHEQSAPYSSNNVWKTGCGGISL